MPYMKYGYWYVPRCNIAFVTEGEALEYVQEMRDSPTTSHSLKRMDRGNLIHYDIIIVYSCELFKPISFSISILIMALTLLYLSG